MKKRNVMNLQRFAASAYDGNAYCDFNAAAAKAIAGKDIILAVFNSTGEKLLAIAGQQGLTINRAADSIEISSKDTEGGWKSKLAGMKEWSIDNNGLYVNGDESHAELSKAFENSDPVCIKVINKKTSKGMFGGLAVITEYSLEAPYDDAMTYNMSLEGMGKLVNLAEEEIADEMMPGDSASAVSAGTTGKTE